MISKILIASDGSKTSQKAIKYAIDLAKEVHASIIALSVIDKRMLLEKNLSASKHLMENEESIVSYMRKTAENHLEEIKSLCEKNEVPVKTVTRVGYPVEEIVKQASKAKADLLIMGARGMSPLSVQALGSVSYGIINYNSNIPVLIVRG
ncbi:MAG: universal stress protein [Syntrophaceae bacterium]|jgi:nucleotide-binding universal stress UspA family protein|nr:universal stress protein [Syntrophaceae bacterium]HOC60528.1 universal stress protein [Smithellaceae bacterium]HQM46387.1 universal stress protein [Smithellaceae bacterium]